MLIEVKSKPLTPLPVDKNYLQYLPVILPVSISTMSNITQVVRTDKSMTNLKKTVIASGLDQILTTRGPFTLFAPTDLAFGKMEKGALDHLLKPENMIALNHLLNHHVVSGHISSKEMKDGDTLTTLNGTTLTIGLKNGQLSVDGIPIKTVDVKTSNGVIHSMDSVLDGKK